MTSVDVVEQDVYAYLRIRNSYERECLRIKRKCARICKYLAYLSLISAYVRLILCFSVQLFRVCIFASFRGGLWPLRFNASTYLSLSDCLSIYLLHSIGFFSCSLSFSLSFSVKTDRNDDVLLARHEHPINHLRAGRKKINAAGKKEGKRPRQ